MANKKKNNAKTEIWALPLSALLGITVTVAIAATMVMIGGRLAYGINVAHSLAVVVGINGSIHDKNIPFIHSTINHRDPIHTEKECCSLMLNKEFYQIQLLTNILSRAWESCFNLSHQLCLVGVGNIYAMWYKFIHRTNVVKIEGITADVEYKNEPPIIKWLDTKLKLNLGKNNRLVKHLGVVCGHCSVSMSQNLCDNINANATI